MQSEAIRSRPPLSSAIALLESAGLPTADLTDRHLDHFFYLGDAGSPSALVGLEILGEVALLRSLVVARDSRRAGVGSALVSHAERAARDSGVRVIYLLTTTAEAFFLGRGYQKCSRDAAPPAIRATREFSGICPASSAFMMRTL